MNSLPDALVRFAILPLLPMRDVCALSQTSRRSDQLTRAKRDKQIQILFRRALREVIRVTNPNHIARRSNEKNYHHNVHRLANRATWFRRFDIIGNPTGADLDVIRGELDLYRRLWPAELLTTDNSVLPFACMPDPPGRWCAKCWCWLRTLYEHCPCNPRRLFYDQLLQGHVMFYENEIPGLDPVGVD